MNYCEECDISTDDGMCEHLAEAYYCEYENYIDMIREQDIEKGERQWA